MELVLELETAQAAASRPGRPRTAWLAALAALLVVAAVIGLWAWRREARERWARREALPQMQRLMDADDLMGAFRVAESVKPVLAGDPAFDRLWRDLVLQPIAVKTEPAGAEVSVKPYVEPDAPWRRLGTTPLERLELPRAYLRFRIEKPGFAPVDLAATAIQLGRERPFRLVPEKEAPPGMVLVPQGRFRFHSMPALELPAFWLDRHEVSNREFAAFVEAGGYRRRELWKEPFTRGGKTLSFEDAMALFRDRTGRPGPSTWELGSFPEGRADYPVAGVSWYEAAAYAEFAGGACRPCITGTARPTSRASRRSCASATSATRGRGRWASSRA